MTSRPLTTPARPAASCLLVTATLLFASDPGYGGSLGDPAIPFGGYAPYADHQRHERWPPEPSLASGVRAWRPTGGGAGNRPVAPPLFRLTTPRVIQERPWLVTIGLGATYGVLAGALNARSEPAWTGGILLDDDARDSLRAGSSGGRDAAGTASDVLNGLLIAYPYLNAIAFRLAALGEDEERSAERTAAMWRMTLMSANMQLITASLTEITKEAAGRKRPNGKGTDSFFSGHASASFAGAGLVCANRKHFEFSRGNGVPRWNWADTAVCGGGIIAATATAFLRMVADKHWASDVLIGASVGLAFGYFVPDWWYKRRDSNPITAGSMIMPVIGRGSFGMAYVRQF